MKLRNKIASGLIGGMLLTGIGAPAFAAPAHAVTVTKCYNSFTSTSTPIKWCHYNYNWFEETFQGRVDGWYYSYRAIWA